MSDPTAQIDANKQSFGNDLMNYKASETVEILSSYLVENVTAIPENVIEFSQKGFTVDLNAMMPERRYRFRFDGSRYEIWRNENDALELLELEPSNV